jgi:hypothetical protein
VELEDRAAAPVEDPRWSTMRSAPAAAKPDSARCLLAATTCGGGREVSGGDRSAWQRGGVSPAWMRRARSGSMASAYRFNTRVKNAVVMSGGQVEEMRRQVGLAEGTVTDKWTVGLDFSTHK